MILLSNCTVAVAVVVARVLFIGRHVVVLETVGDSKRISMNTRISFL